jgi:hypothetical protein
LSGIWWLSGCESVASGAAIPSGPTESQGWRHYRISNDNGLEQSQLFHVRQHKQADVPV